MSKKKKIPYSEKTDYEKIKVNWRKSEGLLEREEWSHSIVRATTAIELAVNLIIRNKFATFGLDNHLVDELLKSCNGLKGKWDKLLMPLFKGKPEHVEFKKMIKNIESLWIDRNAIVHGGEFRKKTTAKLRIEQAKKAINLILETAGQTAIK